MGPNFHRQPAWKQWLFLLYLFLIMGLCIFLSPILCIFEETEAERKKRKLAEDKDLAEQRRKHFHSLTPEEQMAHHIKQVEEVRDLMLRVKDLYPRRGYIKTNQMEDHESSRILEQSA